MSNIHLFMRIKSLRCKNLCSNINTLRPLSSCTCLGSCNINGIVPPSSGARHQPHRSLKIVAGKINSDSSLFNYIRHPKPIRYLSSGSSHNHRSANDEGDHTTIIKLLYAGVLLATGGLAYILHDKDTLQSKKSKIVQSASLVRWKEGTRNEALKEYSSDEVRYHNSMERGVWITYKGSVYDITIFIKHHPGGSHTIMMGAGGDVEPFWQTYTVHQAKEVQKLLSTYKIGLLKELPDEKKEHATSPDHNDPYVNEPKRSKLLFVRSKQPFNAETPSPLLAESYITPTDIFFVRNHLPVPEVDPKNYNLEIYIETEDGSDKEKLLASFTLDELKTKFKPYTMDAVVQCSGNRRSDLKEFKEIKGLDWKLGAIGNATWTGIRFVELLEYLNIQQDHEQMKKIKHVQLEGLDCDMSGQSYGASVTADVAFNPLMDVMLAYEMNGKPLSLDHGFPLRFLAPGIAGARCVKWLSKIVLSSEESRSHWQRNDYKSFSPNVDMFNVEYDKAMSIQEMPVQSAICYPVNNDTIVISRDSSEKVVSLGARGYAYSGGGKNIVRVDISIDNGATWLTANILADSNRSTHQEILEKRNRTWSWCRWTIDIPLPEWILSEGKGQMTILCRAFDSSYNSQPERAETVWNLRGVVNNSWHRINVNVKLE